MSFFEDLVSLPLTVTRSITDGLFPSMPEDNSAAIARQREAERLERIRKGTERVNDIFSQFDDSFYGGIEQSYLDYYKPQLKDQFGRAQEKTTAGLYRSGNIGGSAGAETLADLFKEYNTRARSIADQALNARRTAKTDVARNRADLIGQLEGGAGIESVATSANARASALSQPAPYSPLADAFSQFTNMYALNNQARGQGYPGLGGGNAMPGFGGSNNSSVVTVGGG